MSLLAEQVRTLVLAPLGAGRPDLPVAAARAGAVGVLDLSSGAAAGTPLAAAVAQLRRAPGRRGVRCRWPDLDLLHHALEPDPGGAAPVDLVVLAPATPGRPPTGAELEAVVRRLRRRGVDVLLETTSADGAADLRQAAPTGLVARGSEAGGWGGEESTFVLLQLLLARTGLPAWAHGGVGLHSAAGCLAAGAAGVVLDDQLALVRESCLVRGQRDALARSDGADTTVLAAGTSAPFRCWARAGSVALRRLRERAAEFEAAADIDAPGVRQDWEDAVRTATTWTTADDVVLPVGQAVAFAADLARRFPTTGALVAAFEDQAVEHRAQAVRDRALAAGSPLARSHRTTYPVVQGPMTRVSDTPAFAAAVAGAGGLPFVALALMRGPEVRELLDRTREQVQGRPFGVGVLGFVPGELREEQLRVVREHRPDAALIAGGRPDQALTLEQEGIPTYLHVPSPVLLRDFARAGARRFVLEGRECGGHVGPRSSLVLWDAAVDALLEVLDPAALAATHVLLAGGVHDAVSAAAAVTTAAPLTAAGARAGVLLGTAYLFTREAVETGAVSRTFQEQALACEGTVLLESGPGHATRCAPSPYVELFAEERRRLRSAPAQERRQALEELNLGRLRLATKGRRHAPAGGGPVSAEPEEQRREGLFMIGQVAALRHELVTLPELHRDVCERAVSRLATADAAPASAAPRRQDTDVAIVGMSCLLPGAGDLRQYWDNILGGVDALGEVPPERWRWQRYTRPDLDERDRIRSPAGGFLGPIAFDPLRHGIPPAALSSIEPAQLLTLVAVEAAIEDAGLALTAQERSRTCVVLGAGGGIADLGQRYALRAGLPLLLEDVDADVLEQLPEWTEDSFAGILLNVLAGRVANRLDLGGVNFTVDAACASSLAAVRLAAAELVDGTSDVAITGGVDTVQNPFGYLCFSATHALSPRGRSTPFDEGADGIVIGEGVAVLVLKRLRDAERAGDRVYAVVKGVGGASDGRARSITAPNPAGQVRALQRAYEVAGVAPSSIGLVEAHGTGTAAGDRAEVAALTEVLGAEGGARRCALGSVKSMIGHTKCTAGVAGLAKAALALHAKVLPPTLHVQRPNLGPTPSPLYVNSEARPWCAPQEGPRRAGVSAFGFGGIDFHAVLEEHSAAAPASPAGRRLPSELFVWSAASATALLKAVAACRTGCSAAGLEEADLGALAAATWTEVRRDREADPAAARVRLALVAGTVTALLARLGEAEAALREGRPPRATSGAGLWLDLSARTTVPDEQVAFLYPGQGSPYPGMLRELAVFLPGVREGFEEADRLLGPVAGARLTDAVFPPPAFTPDERDAAARDLARTEVAQPALGAAAIGLTRLLARCGVRPGQTAGHSYGEYPALWAAGVLDTPDLLRLSAARGRCIRDAATGGSAGTDGTGGSGGMAAVAAGRDEVERALQGLPGVWVANLNGPQQTVVSGLSRDLDAAGARLAALGLHAVRLPVPHAFHSPLLASAAAGLEEALERTALHPARLPVSSNTLGDRYPADPAEVRALLRRHLVEPVRFHEQLEALHAAGARVFVEVGPRSVLTGLVGAALQGRPHLAVATDQPGAGVETFLAALARLFVAGVPVVLDPVLPGRTGPRSSADVLAACRTRSDRLRHGWVVRHGRVERADLPTRPPAPVPPVPRVSPVPPVPEEQPVVSEMSRSSYVPPLTCGSPDGLAQFHDLMRRWLDTEREVVLAWLGAGPPAGPVEADPGTPAAAAPDRPPREAGPAVEQLPAGPAPVARQAPGPLAAGVEQDRARPAQAPDVAPLLQQIVADRTGYPVEVLDPDLDMEADLGMDSIKRVEVLGALLAALPGPPPLPDLMERLAGVRTLRAVASALSDVGSAPPDTAVPPVATPPDVTAPLHVASALPGSNGAPPGSNGALPESNGALPHVAVALPGSDGYAVRDGRPLAPPVPASGPTPVLTRLLEIVAERTGYPPEMLDLDLDMESDLGMDSIKRVEILTTLLGSVPGRTVPSVPEAMEPLTRARTLRAVAAQVDALEEPQLAGPAAAPTTPGPARTPAPDPIPDPDPPPAPVGAADAQAPSLVRAVVQAVEVPPLTGARDRRPGPEPLVLVTDDERGVARGLVRALLDRGTAVALLRHSPAPAPDGALDLTDPAVVLATVRRLRAQHGPVSTLVHLLPLRPAPAGVRSDHLVPAVWRERAGQESESLLHLLQALMTLQGDQAPVAQVLAGVWSGSTGPPPAAPSTWSTTHGLVAGMVRSLAHECPATQCRLVDLDPAESADEGAGRLLDELVAGGEPEVVYRDGRRLAPRVRAREGAVPRQAPLALGGDSVVVVTGGGRGITGEVVRELAAAYRPTLVLVGRTPLPDRPEPASTASCTDGGRLRAALAGRARADGRVPRLGDVEREVQQVLRQREVRRTVDDARAAGAAVHYVQADVRSDAEVRSLFETVVGRHGRVDLVLHGAGVVRDQLLRDTSVAALREVVATKAEGALLLARHAPVGAGPLVLFSSVAGRFGNHGQSGYAGANAVLDLLAVERDGAGASRTLSLAWGPWAAGMAAPAHQDGFRARGVQVIMPQEGRRALLRELAEPGPDPLVVLGDGPWLREAPPPLLHGARVEVTGDGLAVDLTLGARDAYLDDHVLDGRRVLPAAFVLEMFVEAAGLLGARARAPEVRDLAVLRGVVLEPGAERRLRLALEPTGPDQVRCALVDPGRPGRCYSAELDLVGSGAPEPEPRLLDLPAPRLSLPQAQRDWLFQGPRLLGLVELEGLGPAGARATVRPSSPETVLRSGTGAWATDPVVVDSALQLAIVWARSQADMTPLPSGFRRLRQVAPLQGRAPGALLRCELAARSSADGHLLQTDIRVCDLSGALLLEIEDVRFTCTRELNRLGRQPELV